MQLAYLHRKPQKKITGVLPASLTKNRRKGSQRKMASHPYSYRVKLNIDNYLHLYTTLFTTRKKLPEYKFTRSHMHSSLGTGSRRGLCQLRRVLIYSRPLPVLHQWSASTWNSHSSNNTGHKLCHPLVWQTKKNTVQKISITLNHNIPPKPRTNFPS